MGFKELKKEFDSAVSVMADLASSPDDIKATADTVFRFWHLRLLFEIAGNLDSLVVSNRNAEKHIERMATAYSDLVKIQKDKAGKGNGA